MLPRALNHMAAPKLGWSEFLDLAASIGCVGVEFRNDLETPLFDGASPDAVGARARALDLDILALAEVKAFDDWSADKAEEAEAVAAIAAACGADMVSLIARNDGEAMDKGARLENLHRAIAGLMPILEKHDVFGLIEPLGFPTCALRDKFEIAGVLREAGATNRFRIVHDTFHHALADDGAMEPELTGIVHISGVVDPLVARHDMQDAHRVLVDANDRLGNIAQINDLLAGGYTGPFSFEPFAQSVHEMADPGPELAKSFVFIQSGLSGRRTDEKRPLSGLPA